MKENLSKGHEQLIQRRRNPVKRYMKHPNYQTDANQNNMRYHIYMIDKKFKSQISWQK